MVLRTGDDGRPDGRHLEWHKQNAWRSLDEELHAGLSRLPERSIKALEQAPIWPDGVVFHREPIPSASERSSWASRARCVLEEADIVFLDPDNGVGNETKKHATYSEIRLMRKAERAVVLITFPGRSMPHDRLLRSLHERLRIETNAQSLFTLQTSVSIPSVEGLSRCTPRQRWFTVIDADAELMTRAREFASALSAIPRVRLQFSEHKIAASLNAV